RAPGSDEFVFLTRSGLSGQEWESDSRPGTFLRTVRGFLSHLSNQTRFSRWDSGIDNLDFYGLQCVSEVRKVVGKEERRLPQGEEDRMRIVINRGCLVILALALCAGEHVLAQGAMKSVKLEGARVNYVDYGKGSEAL